MQIVNTCKGEYASCDVVASAADITAVTALMEGVVSIFEEASTGGTDCATPAKLRTFKFGVNRKIDKLGTTVTIKHTKSTKNEIDIFGHKALFDANFESAAQATGIRMIYGGVR